MPTGKDPGDYIQDHNGDLRAWVEAGLPPMVSPSPTIQAPAPVSQDHPLSLDVNEEGGMGPNKSADDAIAAPHSLATFIEFLRREDGWIWRDEHEIFVRYRMPQYTSTESHQCRERIKADLYGGGDVAWFLELLPPGTLGPRGLEQFSKGAV